MADNIPVVTYTVKSLVQIHPSPWRHPIRWWRTRHLRADHERRRDDLDSWLSRTMMDELAEAEDRAALFGPSELVDQSLHGKIVAAEGRIVVGPNETRAAVAFPVDY